MQRKIWEVTPVTERGTAAWPDLALESHNLSEAGCLAEGVSPIQDWGVLRWMAAVREVPRLCLPDGWEAVAGWCQGGHPTLTVRGPASYVGSRHVPAFDRYLPSISDGFERLSRTVQPLEEGGWGWWDRETADWVRLDTADLADLASHATVERWSGAHPDPSPMNGSPEVYVLGSADAEMHAIARVLADAGQRYVWGTRGGERLRPGQDAEMEMPDWAHPIGVECAVNGAPAVCDHHGDRPEASWPPERSWEASSLGQVWRRLHGDAEPPIDLRAVAALDHNLPAAWRGRAGVPAELAQRALLERTRAIFAPGLSLDEFEAAIRLALETLEEAPPALELCGAGLVGDLRDLPIDGPVVEATGEQYPSAFQFGPTVGAIAGRGYVVTIRRGITDTSPGALALRVGGCGLGSAPGPEPIERWLAGVGEQYGCWGPAAPRPDNLYGSPARGFAGGTLREQGAPPV
jgi:hypothetical protein